MEQHMYPDITKELAHKRRELAPEILNAFRAFGQRVFADGALPTKTKQLIAVAIWVAAEMRAGAAYAHSVIAIDAMHQQEAKGTSA